MRAGDLPLSHAVKPRITAHQNQRDVQRDDDRSVDAQLGHRAAQRRLLASERQLGAHGEDVARGRDNPDDQES